MLCAAAHHRSAAVSPALSLVPPSRSMAGTADPTSNGASDSRSGTGNGGRARAYLAPLSQTVSSLKNLVFQRVARPAQSLGGHPLQQDLGFYNEHIAWDPKRYSEMRVLGRDYAPTRYPIVLLHGLFGYDKICLGPQANPYLQIHYWRGIAEALQHLGCEVHVPSNGPVSSIRSRAYALDRYLSATLPGREVNLIAHSMGGLDARFLITHINKDRDDAKYSINSLTTIATPHRGSSFMDFVQEVLGVGYALDAHDPVVAELARRRDLGQLEAHDVRTMSSHRFKSKYQVLKKLCARFDQPAYANLTRDYCDAFNIVTPNISTVHYNDPCHRKYPPSSSSYAAVAKISRLDPLYISQSVITQREGPNDGLVSVESAKWGDFEGLVTNVDHWGLLPPRSLKRRRGYELVDELENRKQARRGGGYCSLDFYMKVANTLRLKGF
ncbi:Alpha/Beta hydrolase protein [Chytriomyces sp. MP71]|nr:Alpha/Beta hydrolase protein [Chytriomyces sp. MP71]